MGFQAGVTTDKLLRGLILAAIVLIAPSFGFSYGNVGNQSTYLIHALNFVDPDFLKYDWLVRNTTAYHDSFRWVVYLLAKTGSVGWGAALLNSTLIAVDLYVVFRILENLHKRTALVAMTIALLIVCLDRTQGVATSYLLSDGLQPSSIATTGWLVGIWAFLRARYAASGVLLALSGLFHANFLLLGIGLFTLAHIFLGKEKLLSRWGMQVVPSLLVLLPSLPLILAAAGGEGAAQAREIFLTIRAPHHYYPLTYLPDFLYLGGWTACGVAALCAMPDLALRRPLLALYGALGVSVAGATLLTTVVFVPQIAQLYVWRLAPFLQLFSELVASIWLVRQLTERCPDVKYRTFLVVLAGLGALAILRWVVRVTGLSMSVIVCALVVGVYIATWAGIRTRRTGLSRGTNRLGIVALCALLALTGPRMLHVLNQSTLVHPDADDLVQWAHTTSKDTTFLIPPELENFRILSERAVVVDWKSTPIKPGELINWYDRINAVSGRTVHGANDAVGGYRSRSLAELKDQAQRFGANYIVVEQKRHPPAQETDKPVFSNADFSVYAATPAS
jgi:hypothetical protein